MSILNTNKNFIKQLLATATALFLCAGASAAQTDTSTVFKPVAGQYASMRIPAIMVTKKGTLLAFCEGRINNANDYGDMDILERRSTDGGNTWSDIKVVAVRKDGKPTSNPTPVVDSKGTIHLLYQRDYAAAYHIQSTDDGKTWSEAKDITPVFEKFKAQYPWKVLAPGPGHALQLSSGRIVVPVWLANPEKMEANRAHRPSCVASIYSDDFGKSWQVGDIIANTAPDFVHPSESMAVQLKDGRVMMNIRTETPIHLRAVSYSPDGATHWTKPVFDEGLYEPVCMASIISLKEKNKDGSHPILFINPDSKGMVTKVPRQRLTAKVSFDEGKTWPVEKVLDSGFAGYSDIAVGPNGKIYCLYETNNSSSKNYRLVLLRTTLTDIEKQY